MSFVARSMSALAAASLLLVALPRDASATNYSLWIHGRNTSQSTTPGNYADFSYWGSSATSAGVNKKAVNWDGVGRISSTNDKIRNALDCFCTGSNWCYIAAHSAGDLQLGYALALYGGSQRSITNAAPNSSGVCSGTAGTQTGWNIKWVNIAAGAGGGSELADIGSWAVSDALTQDLKTSAARTLYNHNETRSAMFYMFAGSKGTLYSGTLPGQDDEAVAYHSAGGLSTTGSFCNPGDWFCDDALYTGTATSQKSGANIAKWTNHTVTFRDSNEGLNHYTNGSWGGIVSQARADMATYAF